MYIEKAIPGDVKEPMAPIDKSRELKSGVIGKIPQ